MKKIILTTFFALTVFTGFAQITVTTAFVPTRMEGKNGTNNDRLPIWFWAELTGLTPNATYRYYTSMDSINAAVSSNGAGNPYLINMVSGTVRRTANASMSNSAGHDSLVADSTGFYAGWFGVEPTGNGRYKPNNILVPQIMLNNGAGGISIATRVRMIAYPVKIIKFGSSSADSLGSAIYDSLDAQPKNFIAIYDNVTATGRPINIAMVESDGLNVTAVTQIASFYRNNVDTMAMHWGAIIPNDLANGVRALEERAFTTGLPIDTVTDADGWWCSGVNTVNMATGTIPQFLNSTFVLSSSATIPDTAYTTQTTFFTANSNDPVAYYNWDFGDNSLPATGANAQHVYTLPGVVTVTLVISNGACTDTITHTVVVLLGTNIPRAPGFGFVIAPNPTDGQFTISGMRGNNEREIVITNLLGEVLFTHNAVGSNIQLDLTGYPAGIYLVQVRDKDSGKTGVRKISVR